MFTTVDSVNAYLGRTLSGDELRQAEFFLKSVEAAIISRVPDMAARLASGAVAQELLESVIAGVVVRKLTNPDGKMSERIDDYSYQRYPDAAKASLWLTDDEWALLLPDSHRGAFSVRPSFGPGWGRRWFCP